MDADRIHAAVTSLLNACYESNDPVVTLYAEVETYRASGEWSQLQLAQLQLMALQTLKSIVSRYKENGHRPRAGEPGADGQGHPWPWRTATCF